MATILKRTAVGTVAALGLAATIAATPTPASAQWGWGWGWGAAGFLGGLALGAAIATPYYGYGYPYYGGYYGYGYPYYAGYYNGRCYWVRQPVYDYYGYFHGYRRMRQCY